MIIWAIKSSTEFHRLVLAYDRDAEVALRFRGKPFGDTWHPLLVEMVYHNDTTMGNFPNLAAGVLVCDSKALAIIEPLISESVEFLPLECEKGNFYAINVTNLRDCLDHPHSEFDYFQTGNIKRILRYEFKAECVANQSIFKIPEKGASTIFVSDALKALVENHGLTGLTFRKVWEG